MCMQSKSKDELLSKVTELLEENRSLKSSSMEDRKFLADTEQKLKASELKYRSLIECSSDAIFCVDEKGEYQFTNQLFASTFGQTPDYFIGKTFWDIYDKEQADIRFETTNRVFQTGESESIEVEVPLPNKKLYFLATANPVKDETGKVILNLTLAADITKLKYAEMALVESESQNRKKLNSILSGENPIGDLELADIIDIEAIQSMMDDIYALTNIPVAIIDLNNNLLVNTGWQDVCLKFHRVHLETRKKCFECDTELSKDVKSGTFKSYLCKNNLWDNVTPLIVGEKHVGNLFTGQFFFEDAIPDDQVFIDQAAKYGFDVTEYMKAIRKVPVWSREAIEKALVFYTKLANMISSLSHSNLVLARASEARKEAEWKFRALFEKGPIGVAYHQMIYDDNNNPVDYLFLDANESYIELTGVDPRGKMATEAFPGIEKDAFDWIGTFGKVAKTGETIRFEQFLEANNRWYDCVGYQYKPDHFVATFLEITKRKTAEKKLIESEEKYGHLHENTGIGIGYYKPDGTVISYNKLAASHMNGVPEDFTGKSIYSIYPKAEAEFYHNRIKESVLSKESLVFEDCVQLPGGEKHFLSTFSKILNQNQEISGIQIISQDITNLKSIENKLRLSEKRLESIFLVAPTGIGVVKERIITEVNPKICELTGYSADELIGKPSVILYSSQEEYDFVGKEKYRQIAEKGTGVVETIWIKKDGEKMDVILASTPIDASDHSKGVTFTVLDISKRKLAEILLREKTDEIESQNEEYQQINEELIQTNDELHKAKLHAEESDRLKTAFLQNMSHEIRTPMNAIMGFSALLKNNFDNRPKLEKFSDIISQRCNDLLDIINDILDIAKIESGQLPINLEKCDLNSLFSDLTSFFTEHQKHLGKEHINFSLQSNCNDNQNIIVTDSGKLKQIFINLIGNAFKFTENGSIEAGCRVDNNNQLIFFVSDTGIGIPENQQSRIFERFTQLNPGANKLVSGTGLGLSIVKGLITLLGGEIILESKPGIGSTFSFCIPFKNSMPSYQEIVQTEKNNFMNTSEKTILLVEDDMYNTEYLKEILSSAGYNIIHTEYGKEAVKIALNQDVDLVLMDVRLPDINGYEATQQIRPIKPSLKIIAQTAYASNGEKQKAIEAGCNDYISKPAREDLLLKMIEKNILLIS